MSKTEPGPREPHLDDDGLLWCNGRWVAIPDAQLPVAELILSEQPRLVRTAAIADTYARSGSSGHPASVRTMLHRLAARCAEVGLQLHMVRGKGVILDVPG